MTPKVDKPVTAEDIKMTFANLIHLCNVFLRTARLVLVLTVERQSESAAQPQPRPARAGAIAVKGDGSRRRSSVVNHSMESMK